MKISIVTPSFNQGRYIEEAILSVSTQMYSDIEHIVIDGGSTDETIGILKKYPHLKWISEPDNGQAEALNKGLKMATGDLIGWLNADDTYLSTTFNIVSEFFSQRTDVALTYGCVYVIDEESRVIRKRITPEFDFGMMVRLGTCYAQPTFFFRRSVLDRVGFMDATLRQAMDYDFILKVGEKLVVRKLPRFLGSFRTHSGSMSHSGVENSLGVDLSASIQRRHAGSLPRGLPRQLHKFKDACILYWFKILGRIISIPELVSYTLKKSANRRSKA